MGQLDLHGASLNCSPFSNRVQADSN